MSDVDALQTCLAAEHAACYGYGVLGGVLAGARAPAVGTGPGVPDAAAAYQAHRAARDALVNRIAALDADPVAAEPAYRTPFKVRSVASCRRLARLLERRCADVYGYAVAQTIDDERTFTAAQLSACVVRGITWGSPVRPFPGVRGSLGTR